MNYCLIGTNVVLYSGKIMKMGSDGGYVSLGVDVLSLNYTVKHGE